MKFCENKFTNIIQESFALQFANDWINSWNTHDIKIIMDHYDEMIIFQSPIIIKVNNDPTGTITNKGALAQYFTRALAIYPDLHFELYKVFISINSIIIHYKTINDKPAAEFMEINAYGKITKVCAHYEGNSF